MKARSGAAGTPLNLVGLAAEDEKTYRSLLRASGSTRAGMTEVTGLSLAELDEVIGRFEGLGLVRVAGDIVVAEPPQEVLGKVIQGESDRMRRDADAVDSLRNLLPTLISDFRAASERPGDSVDVRAVEQSDVMGLLRTLAQESPGDVLWFRPDQWRLPLSTELDEFAADLVASGRQLRAVYPARALEQAPDVLRGRAELGEQIRIVADVPSRITIFGEGVALTPDRWGEGTARRLVVREHALVGALRGLFQHVWDQGMAVPGLDAGVDAPDGQRHLLLHELSRGAKDEHIARTLGVSLRTVRRRIADIMDELEAESRFQAGAEAVRRGWL